MPHASFMLLHIPYVFFHAPTFSSWLLWKRQELPDAVAKYCSMREADIFTQTTCLACAESMGMTCLACAGSRGMTSRSCAGPRSRR